MSNADPSLRSCLYKQTAIYYFIRVSLILTSSSALGHDPGIHRCRMEENHPTYFHTKYEKFLISGCRVISNKKTSKQNLVIEKVNGRTDGRTDDEWTNGTDENYIPLRHTKYAGCIIKGTGSNTGLNPYPFHPVAFLADHFKAVPL